MYIKETILQATRFRYTEECAWVLTQHNCLFMSGLWKPICSSIIIFKNSNDREHKFFFYFINFPVAWNMRTRVSALVISMSLWWMTIWDDQMVLLTIWYITLIVSLRSLRWWPNSSSWHLRTFLSQPCPPNSSWLLTLPWDVRFLTIELPGCHPNPPSVCLCLLAESKQFSQLGGLCCAVERT